MERRSATNHWLTLSALLLAVGVACFVVGLIGHFAWLAASGFRSTAKTAQGHSTATPRATASQALTPTRTAVAQASPTAASKTTPTEPAAPLPPTTTAVRSMSTATAIPPTATATPVPPTATPSTTTYVVRKGDTLSAIAQRFGVSLAALESANPSIDPDRLTIGMKITIPSTRAAQPTATATSAAGSAPAKQVYVVQAGDTLTRIAIQFGVTEADLVAANPGLNPNQITVGQRLVIPGGAPSPSVTVTPSPSPAAALYPAPVLVSPRNGTSITGKNQEITLRWTWSRSLGSAEWFEVQMWKAGESPQGRVWTKQTSWLISKTLYPGNYSWRIVVVRQRGDGTGQAVSNPSTEWLVKWN